MFRNILIATLLLTLLTAQTTGYAQHAKQISWLVFENGEYKEVDDRTVAGNTAYLNIQPQAAAGSVLSLRSAKPFFIFINGKLMGEFQGDKSLKIDSLNSIYSASNLVMAIHQDGFNPNEFHVSLSHGRTPPDVWATTGRPSTHFRDFVIFSGLIIVIAFLVITHLNPKLASDYRSIEKIISARDADDAQSNARLTSSNNFQFYVLASLLVAFYLIVIARHLPDDYALAISFEAESFGSWLWLWIKLSMFILSVFLGKIVLVFALTRLFAMKGLARVHFFNWMRLMLVVIGTATVVLFIYFILRGQSETFFEILLVMIVVTMAAWVFLVFMKLNGKTEHSMFHLFSYICATEIIPLLITIKVLFQ